MSNGEKNQADEISDLLISIQNGSSGAFVKLAEKYAPLLDSEVSRYSGSLSVADIEDLKQGALVSLYRAALAYNGEKGVTFGLFAKICIVNGIADTLRYLNRKNSDVSMDELFEDEQPESDTDPEDMMLDKERFNELKAQIRSVLSDMERRIFDLYISGYSYAEIADITDSSKKSVDNALRRLKDKLKKLI